MFVGMILRFLILLIETPEFMGNSNEETYIPLLNIPVDEQFNVPFMSKVYWGSECIYSNVVIYVRYRGSAWNKI